MSVNDLMKNQDFMKSLNKDFIIKSFTKSGGVQDPNGYKLLIPASFDKAHKYSVSGTIVHNTIKFVVGKETGKSLKETLEEDDYNYITSALIRRSKNIQSKKDLLICKKINKSLLRLEKYLKSPRMKDYKIINDCNFIYQLKYNPNLENLNKTDRQVFLDVKNIIQQFKNDFVGNILTKNSKVTLDPKFGYADQFYLYLGAEADIIIDNKLYEFKTSKNNTSKNRDIIQTYIYFLLDCLDKIYSNSNDSEILDYISIYRPRFKTFETLYTSQLSQKELVNSLIKIRDFSIKQLYIFYCNEIEKQNNIQLSTAQRENLLKYLVNMEKNSARFQKIDNSKIQGWVYNQRVWDV